MSLGGDLAKAHGEQIRLAALQLLAEMPSRSLIEQSLHPAIEAMDLPCTADQLRGHLTWLSEQGLVDAETNSRGDLKATLLERGYEVARGATFVPGVARAKLRRS